jgi:hypothetical protein
MQHIIVIFFSVKQILASKGDISLFQNGKRNPTVPKEFNLSTSRKSKQAPLSELFNKVCTDKKNGLPSNYFNLIFYANYFGSFL